MGNKYWRITKGNPTLIYLALLIFITVSCQRFSPSNSSEDLGRVQSHEDLGSGSLIPDNDPGEPPPTNGPGGPEPPAQIPSEPNPNPSVADGVKVAFIGDTDANDDTRSVMRLIRQEKADLVVVAGDTDYGSGERKWDAMIREVSSTEVGLVAFGNHDLNDSDPDLVVQLGMNRLRNNPKMKCMGEYGRNMTCIFRGLYIVLSEIRTERPSHGKEVQYIQDQLAKADPNMWRLCVWHHNQAKMQVGGKPDQVGWKAYEICREKGALISTGHEHSYSRTHLLSNMESQTIHSKGPNYLLEEGKTIAWVSGLGGHSIRDQQQGGEYWGSIYTSSQGAKFGALFGTFGERTAQFEFKNVNGEVVDKFTIQKRY